MTTESSPFDALIAHLHGAGRLRVWSLIVTILGDLGGESGTVPLATLLRITGHTGIDERAVRTALSRLTADGLAMSEREGGTTTYRFAPAGAALFAQAQRRIYEAPETLLRASWRMAVLPPARAAERQAQLKALRAQGAATASTGLALWPAHRRIDPDQALVTPFAPDQVPRWIVDAFLNEKARQEWQDIATIARKISMHPPGDAAEVLRMMLLHRWRRAILRYPPVPTQILPADWAFPDAHREVAAAYRHLSRPGLPTGRFAE